MTSPVPFKNRLVYLLQTKLQTELSNDLLWDIECTLFDYGRECSEVSEREKAYWREKALG